MDDKKLNDMISMSDVPLKKQDNFWFSYGNQKILAYKFATDLMLSVDEMTVEEAIDTAIEFNSCFYNKVIKKD